MPHPDANRVEDRIGDGGGHHCRRRFAKPDRHVVAVDEADVQRRHIADAQRRVTVEIGIGDLAVFKARAFVQRQAQAPQRRTFDLGPRTTGINDCPGIDNQRQFLDRHITGFGIDADPGHTGNPGRHVALLAKAGGEAKPGTSGQCRAPTGQYRRAPHHSRLAQRAANGIRRGTRVAAGTGQMGDAERHRICLGGVCRLIDKAFDRPIGPARADGPQPAGAKAAVGDIVRNGAHPLHTHVIPVIGAGDGKRIIGLAIAALGHERRHHHLRRPAGTGGMVHRHGRTGAIKTHVQGLHRW